MTPPPAVSPAAVSPGTAPALRQVAAAPLSTRLAPETPGCANTGLSGRWSPRQRVSAELPVQGGPKAEARARRDNPVQVLQTLRPAMHMCVVDRFDPADTAGTGRPVYHL